MVALCKLIVEYICLTDAFLFSSSFSFATWGRTTCKTLSVWSVAPVALPCHALAQPSRSDKLNFPSASSYQPCQFQDYQFLSLLNCLVSRLLEQKSSQMLLILSKLQLQLISEVDVLVSRSSSTACGVIRALNSSLNDRFEHHGTSSFSTVLFLSFIFHMLTFPFSEQLRLHVRRVFLAHRSVH